MTVRTYRIADIVCRVEMEQGQEIAMFRGFEDTSGEEPTIRVRMYQNPEYSASAMESNTAARRNSTPTSLSANHFRKSACRRTAVSAVL